MRDSKDVLWASDANNVRKSESSREVSVRVTQMNHNL